MAPPQLPANLLTNQCFSDLGRYLQFSTNAREHMDREKYLCPDAQVVFDFLTEHLAETDPALMTEEENQLQGARAVLWSDAVHSTDAADAGYRWLAVYILREFLPDVPVNRSNQ